MFCFLEGGLCTLDILLRTLFDLIFQTPDIIMCTTAHEN